MGEMRKYPSESPCEPDEDCADFDIEPEEKSPYQTPEERSVPASGARSAESSETRKSER